eukprot:gene51991-70854_t
MLGAFWLSWRSQLPFAIGGPDGNTTSILAAMAASGVASAESVDLASQTPDIIEKLEDCIRARRPIEFVFSMFPCKGCHPLRTMARRGSEIDFGEVKCLVRLVRLVAALRRVYRPGARITILSNGRRYSEVFFEQESEVETYRSNIAALIGFLGSADVL